MRCFLLFFFASLAACASDAGSGADDAPADPASSPSTGGKNSNSGQDAPAATTPPAPSTVPTPFTPARRFAAAKATWAASVPSASRGSAWDLIDLDGDARPDLVTATASGWTVQKNTGSGFAAPGPWAAPAAFTSLNASCQALLDVDGDAKPDLVDLCVGSAHWDVYLNSGTGFAASATVWTLPPGAPTSTGSLGHLPGTRQPYAQIGTWAALDVDGDGRVELVAPHAKASWEVFASTGAGFAPTARYWSVPQVPYDPKNEYGFGALTGGLWAALDLNGDRLLDLVVTGQTIGSARVTFTQNGTSYWKAYLGAATGFSTAATPWTVPNGAEYPEDTDRFGPTSLAFDLDGDGRPDLVQLGRDAVPGADVGSPHWIVYPSFRAASFDWPLPMASVGGNALVSREGDNWVVIDLDGDRRPDLVTYGPSGFGMYAGTP